MCSKGCRLLNGSLGRLPNETPSHPLLSLTVSVDWEQNPKRILIYDFGDECEEFIFRGVPNGYTECIGELCSAADPDRQGAISVAGQPGIA